MNVYQRLNAARQEFHSLKLAKTGHNKFAGYHYFELGDFLIPALNVFAKHGLCGTVSFEDTVAMMCIRNVEKPDEFIVISSPMGSAALKGCHEVQNIGAVETYQRRYLWVAALEIVEHDAVDSSEPVKQEPRADYISAQRKDDLVQDAQRISKDYADGNKLDAFARYDEITDTEERLFLWELFAENSRLRTFLNAAGDIKPMRRDELTALAHKIDIAARALLTDEAVRLRGQVTDQVEVAFLGNFLSEQTKKFLRDSKKAVPA